MALSAATMLLLHAFVRANADSTVCVCLRSESEASHEVFQRQVVPADGSGGGGQDLDDV